MATERQNWPSLRDLIDPPGPTAQGDDRPQAPAKPAQRAAPNRAQLCVLKQNSRRLPNITRICRHLDCELIRFRAAGEPVCVFIGRGFAPNADRLGERATPRFRTIESLEYFCKANLRVYLALNALPRRPRDWFWNQP
jgi:hypothetical protein